MSVCLDGKEVMLTNGQYHSVACEKFTTKHDYEMQGLIRILGKPEFTSR